MKNSMIDEKFIDKLISNNFKRGFLGGYFGTREASLFLKTPGFMELIGDSPFFDISAGTGQFPYYLAKTGHQVFVNDICYYAGTILKCWTDPKVTGDSQDIKEWITEWARAVDPSNVKPVTGYLTRLNKDKYFSEDMSKYLDGLLTSLYPEPLIQFAVGNILSTVFSFRGRNFCKTSQLKKLSNEVTPEDIYPKLLRSMMKARRIREKIPKDIKSWSNIGDSSEALDKVCLPKDTVVYMDTAWPYNKNIPIPNPYSFFIEGISSIISQQKITAGRLWERETPEDQIINTVKLWMNKAFDKDAKYFIITTQDTNYPDPDKVFEEVSKDFNLVKLFKVDDYSNSANKKYYNYWGFFSKK